VFSSEQRDLLPWVKLLRGYHAGAVMLHRVSTDRTYPPETVALMTRAFDRACQSLSTRINDTEAVRESLALIILRYVDHGEHDPVRLADVAILEFGRQ
jgi:hypothetical protein